MSVGTAFHPRTAPLNRKMQWREWAGYYASLRVRRLPRHRVQRDPRGGRGHRRQPPVQVPDHGPDAIRLADRVITRDATKLKVGQVYYTPWCDEHGKVIDDGTVHRVAEHELRWTAADPQYPLADPERRRAGRRHRGRHRGRSRRSRSRARSAARCSRRRPARTSADLRYFRRRATKIAGHDSRRQPHRLHGRPRLRAVDPRRATPRPCGTPCSRPAQAYAIRPAGMLALDVTRLEAGLILLEVDYTSARHAMNPEQNYSPFEIGLGRARELRQGGLRRPRAPSRRSRRPAVPRDASSASSSTGTTSSACTTSRACRPRSRPTTDRSHVPVFAEPGARSARRPRTAGARSSSRRSRSPRSPPRYERIGTRLQVEWTVEGRRGRVNATVVELPFLDLDRKRA